ncbi:uncharacterized protein EI90DRAFT_3279280 [Cantharellus anzutake]|uniref:uncharacterized protein n=1 Tax=Cantharellus anzutake TaxID=1750568 RepID=UPI001906C376|nr:uncharacterized protein EI90DRAFT_3279280 [Cantharellus anzutake]KAF8339703.1 hypothetical protein EI90DRAFT_3279280 [Cantharellus anzutake]
MITGCPGPQIQIGAQLNSGSRSPLNNGAYTDYCFTGFLGSGKTSIILSLLPKLPKDYKVVLLKNEFGDVEVDSKLAEQSSLTAVSEILNGCMCCVLVGQMKTALLEIRDPWDFKLDAILTVIDAENFTGYEDTSTTARMQAQYSDTLIINKWEHVSERALDIVTDHLYTLNEATPKIRCLNRNDVDPALIFGLDTKLFSDAAWLHEEHSCLHHGLETHHDEVETATITLNPVEQALSVLPKDVIYRVKGFISLADEGRVILNWAFGRFDLVPYEGAGLTMMGERGEVKNKWEKRFVEALERR